MLWAGGFLLFCWAATGLKAGTIGTAPAKVPDDFPSDFPVYKNAVIKKYAPMVSANPKLGTVLMLETADAKTTVLDFYREALPAQGWAVEKPMSTAPDSLTASRRRAAHQRERAGFGVGFETCHIDSTRCKRNALNGRAEL